MSTGTIVDPGRRLGYCAGPRNKSSTQFHKGRQFVFSAVGPQELGARSGGNMISPCDEGDATGRGQPVKSTLDPLEPTIDVALNDFGGVWGQYPKVPRTTRRSGKRVCHNERLLAISGHLRYPCRTSHDGIPLPATMFLDNA
jgi:hypothetical protein